MLYRISKPIKFLPLLVLLVTGLQLFIYDYEWYSPVYYIFVIHFHSYGIFTNITLLYYSRKFANSIVSDLSIIGLIMMNLFCASLYINNGGEPFTKEEQMVNIMMWDTVITGIILLLILTAWYLEYKKISNWFTKFLNINK